MFPNYWNPGIWTIPTGGINFIPPIETFYILQENGDRIILEDGTGFILLEEAP